MDPPDRYYNENDEFDLGRRMSTVEDDVETAPVVLSSLEDAGPGGDGREPDSSECLTYNDGTIFNDGWDSRGDGRGNELNWVRRYLGRISSASASLWNASTGYINSVNEESDDAHRRRMSMEPRSAQVWDDHGIHRGHAQVEEHHVPSGMHGRSRGDVMGKDDYGIYTSLRKKKKEHCVTDDPQRRENEQLDRGEALNERYKKQLRTYDKDQYGVPLPSTARRFSFFASPYSISEVCTGLGVYLTNIRAAIVLTLLMCVLMIYPLVDNVNTQNWSQEYYLYTSDALPIATCEKGYWNSVYTSLIIRTSVGGHCDGGPYASPYGCSSKCVWDSSRLSIPKCSSLDYGAYYNGSNVCDLHLPCVPSSHDPYSPDGPCMCCNFELSEPTITNGTETIYLENNQERIPAARFWILFLTQLVFMGWLLALMHFQAKIVQSNGNNVVGPSDFSIWIEGIKPVSAVDSYLRKWCQQFGPIMAAFNVPSVGECIRIGREVEDILIRKEEADADPGHSSWNPLLWIYRRFLVGKPKGLQEKLEDKKIKLKIFERQESTPTGYALATFRYTDAASKSVDMFDTSPFGRFCEMITCGLTSTKPLLHGSAVNVIRAPEPSDMIWEHTQCSTYEIWKRRFISWTITICVIMAGAGIQYGLASGAERLREERYIADIAAGNGDEQLERVAAIKTTRIRVVTILIGVMVVIINFSTMLTVRFLAWYERWTTRTSMERWVLLKLSFSQLLNAFAAPLIASYVSGNKSGWYVRGGLVEAAFFVQCSNALLPPLVHLLGIGDNFKFYILSPFARTQKMLNRLLAPPFFPMAEQHAASVTSIGLAMFYMPVLPISPYISLIGLVLSYLTNKWIALRRAAAPPNLNGMVTSSLNFLLRLLPLVQLILMKYLYFVGYSSVTPAFWTGIAFWIVFMIAPIRALLGTVKRYRRPPVAVGLSYSRLLGGMRLGVGDVYSPVVPKTCSSKFKHQVAETFAQLAPAAFDSILNGDEIAEQISLYGNRFTLEQVMEHGEAAPWTPSSFQSTNNIRDPNTLRRQQTAAMMATSKSLTGSIAAGFQETLNLLWRPHDPDHPEDVFRRPPQNIQGRPEACDAQPEIRGESSYGVEDDVPIRAVYSHARRDEANAACQEDFDQAIFRPLGSGLNYPTRQ